MIHIEVDDSQLEITVLQHEKSLNVHSVTHGIQILQDDGFRIAATM